MSTTPSLAKPCNSTQTQTETQPHNQDDPKKASQRKKSQEKTRGRKPPEDIVREIFQRLQNGEQIPQLRREYDIPSTTIHRELRRFNPKRYQRIMNERHPKHHVPISKTWKRLENGESTRRIAATYHMSHGTLRRKLERFDNKRYRAIMSKRGAQHTVPLSKTWKNLEDGETLGKVAQEYRIPPETLRRRLVRADRDRYMSIRRNRKLGTIPPEVLLRKLASGKSVTKLAREYGTCYSKMRRIFLRRDKGIYQDIIDRTKNMKSEGYGSEEARKEGADSDFELQVRNILMEHNIKFCTPTLKLGKHRYFPDFMTSNQTIVEAAGVTNREYWQRYREKTRNYAKHGYPALIVVPYNLRKRAKDYLPHSSKIASVWISDFRKDPERYLRLLRPP